MVYIIPYKATFECPKGHLFEAEASPVTDDSEAQCPRCYREWVAENVPNGRQIGASARADGNVLNLVHTIMD